MHCNLSSTRFALSGSPCSRTEADAAHTIPNLDRKNETQQVWRKIKGERPVIVLYHATKSYDMGPTSLLHLWMEACFEFLLPLQIHCPSLGFTLWTLCPVSSMLTVTPPRMTEVTLKGAQTSWKWLCESLFLGILITCFCVVLYLVTNCTAFTGF